VLDPDIEGCFKVLEGELSPASVEDGDGGNKAEKEWFMGGDAPSRADFVLHFFVGLAVQPGYVDLDRYPKLKAWMARCEAREAWKRALEKGNGYDLNIPGQW